MSGVDRARASGPVGCARSSSVTGFHRAAGPAVAATRYSWTSAGSSRTSSTTGVPASGLSAVTACSYSAGREVSTTWSCRRSERPIPARATARNGRGISSNPSSTGRIWPSASSSSASVTRARSVGSARPTRKGYASASRCAIHASSRCLVGSHAATGSSTGTGSLGLRRSSRSRTSRNASMLLPAPPSPSTTSRRGEPGAVNTSAMSRNRPDIGSGLLSVGTPRTAAQLTITASERAVVAHRTGSGHGSSTPRAASSERH